jgi:hypothetical protein
MLKDDIHTEKIAGYSGLIVEEINKLADGRDIKNG